ncbi:hypothetical protein CISIN_1g040996mg [Citrus sinensis]|uniref:Uncharacterized protein n=1 Tax=Citrus sinensis TaxID=2711 RepID=A0A067D922_CITSI|nr:hypothetical protein CISIN_1g040996mg [Citrus sinensis]
MSALSYHLSSILPISVVVASRAPQETLDLMYLYKPLNSVSRDDQLHFSTQPFYIHQSLICKELEDPKLKLTILHIL